MTARLIARLRKLEGPAKPDLSALSDGELSYALCQVAASVSAGGEEDGYLSAAMRAHWPDVASAPANATLADLWAVVESEIRSEAVAGPLAVRWLAQHGVAA